MNILNKQYLIDNICSVWKQNYFFAGNWRYGHNKEEIYNNLVALGDNKTEENIAEVIGNSSWTRLECSECEQDSYSVVTMSVEEYGIYLCKSCLIKGLELLGEDNVSV